MPSRADDKYFGGKRGASGKAHRAMIRHYGKKKGEQVYHATKNKSLADRMGSAARRGGRRR